MTVPLLDFAAQPGGLPPPVLRGGASGDHAMRPAGGAPMLVLRRAPDVLRALTDRSRFAMAGVTPSGELAGCPLTGAEMQSPDGGLLNMDAPALLAYRRRLGHLFTRRAAEATRPAVTAIAGRLAAGLAGQETADVLAEYARPFTAAAISMAMGTPRSDEEQLAEFARIAFAVVPGAGEVPRVARAWDGLYACYDRPWADGLAGAVPRALDGFTAAQAVHATATVSNGFGAVLPVLAVALAEVAQRPRLVAACASGERTWDGVAEALLRRRAMFPVALPRVVLRDTELAGRHVREGDVVLPSLTAAAHDVVTPAPCSIAFGAGPHFCPGAALARVWLAGALGAFFGAFPAARLAGRLEWQAGTLPVPREIVLSLH